MDVTDDPLALLAAWVAEAAAAGSPLPGAMTLATAGADGTPQARTVLVTTVDPATGSLRFHSSTSTRKTVDVAANPAVSGVFLWPALGRQVVLAGAARELDAAVSRAAFPTRPRHLQLLAWAYDELTPTLTGPDHAVEPGAVERAFAAAATRNPLPVPPSWTTVEVVPARMDFWRAGDERTPPSRTRFVRDGDEWRSFPVLP